MSRESGREQVRAEIENILSLRSTAEPDTQIITVAGWRTLTFRRWQSESTALAARLETMDLPSGTPVVLQFSLADWDRYAIASLAVPLAGLVAVPVPAGLTSYEFDHRVAACRAGVVVKAGGTGFTIDSREPTRPLPATDDPVIELLFTSGSAKGIPQLVACGWDEFAAVIAHPKVDKSGRHEKLGHTFSVGTNASQLLLRSALRTDSPRIAVGAGSLPYHLRGLLEEERPNLLSISPAEARTLISLIEQDNETRWQSLRAILLTGGAANSRLLAELAEHLPGVAINNSYGLTEGGGAVLRSRYDVRYPARLGRPGPNTEVKIIDQTGRTVPAGSIGEICLRTLRLPMRHYHDDPQNTATTFSAGWVHTGDLGRVDPAGMVHLVGRRKDVVVRGGQNVACLAVEQALCDLPSVLDAAVLGVRDELMGEDLVAVVVAADGLSENELLTELGKRLARAMVPSRAFAVEDLPRLPGGKTDKERLRRMIRSGALTSVGGGPSGPPILRDRDSVLDAMCRTWADVLGRPIGPADDFYLAGGDSLAILQIVRAAESIVEVELDVVAFLPMTDVTAFTEKLLTRDAGD